MHALVVLQSWLDRMKAKVTAAAAMNRAAAAAAAALMARWS